MTSHSMVMCKRVRRISVEHLRETITNGREEPTDEQGRMGGLISRFHKNFVIRDGHGPTTKSLVAVCEVVDNKCILITAYYR
jgi:hypothetical protein